MWALCLVERLAVGMGLWRVAPRVATKVASSVELKGLLQAGAKDNSWAVEMAVGTVPMLVVLTAVLWVDLMVAMTVVVWAAWKAFLKAAS